VHDFEDGSDDEDMPAFAAPRRAPRERTPLGGARGGGGDSDCIVLSDSDDDGVPAAAPPPRPRADAPWEPPAPPSGDEDEDSDGPAIATHRPSGAKAARAPPRSAAGGSSAAAAKAADKAARAEERRAAAAQKKADKEAAKAGSAAARQEQRAATGKLAHQQLTVFIDTRLAATAAGRALGDALAAAKFLHSVAALPVEGSCCWVRHAARADAWPGAVPWPGAAAAAAAARAGAAAVPYVMLVLEAPRLVAAVQAHGSLEPLVAQVRGAHPGATLCVCGIGVHAHLRQRERSEFSTADPTAGFSRAGVDAALARLVTHARGVRQRLPKDVAGAAEHGVLLTDALARQPFRSEESFLALFGGSTKAAKPSYGGGAAGGAAAQPDGDEDEAAASQGGAAKGKRAREPSLADAWVAALARVPMSSADAAAAIARAYPCMAALMAAYRAPGLTDAAARGLLANLSAREALAPGGKARRVGPACSERVWKLFRARPPGDAGMDEV
jgi:exonuclease SbcC